MHLVSFRHAGSYPRFGSEMQWDRRATVVTVHYVIRSTHVNVRPEGCKLCSAFFLLLPLSLSLLWTRRRRSGAGDRFTMANKARGDPGVAALVGPVGNALKRATNKA